MIKDFNGHSWAAQKAVNKTLTYNHMKLLWQTYFPPGECKSNIHFTFNSFFAQNLGLWNYLTLQLCTCKSVGFN